MLCLLSFLKWHVWIDSASPGKDAHAADCTNKGIQSENEKILPNLQIPALRKVPQHHTMLVSPPNTTQEETIYDRDFLLNCAGKQTMRTHYF